MEAALAEFKAEEVGIDVEEDRDFFVEKGVYDASCSVILCKLPPPTTADEEDKFESDFESTDEEAYQEGEEAAEKTVQDEERRKRKVRPVPIVYQCDVVG